MRYAATFVLGSAAVLALWVAARGGDDPADKKPAGTPTVESLRKDLERLGKDREADAKTIDQLTGQLTEANRHIGALDDRFCAFKKEAAEKHAAQAEKIAALTRYRDEAGVIQWRRVVITNNGPRPNPARLVTDGVDPTEAGVTQAKPDDPIRVTFDRDLMGPALAIHAGIEVAGGTLETLTFLPIVCPVDPNAKNTAILDPKVRLYAKRTGDIAAWNARMYVIARLTPPK